MLDSPAFPPASPVKSIAILISGHGSNMASVARTCTDERWSARVSAVLCSREDAPGLALARELGLHVEVVPHAQPGGRDAFEARLADRLDACDADVVVLAGFMRILGDAFVERFAGRMVNVHPSLLPSFPGLRTHERALDAGVRLHGATVHLVTPTLDHGPILAQAAVPVRDDDDPQALAARVLRAEHRLLPRAVRWMVEDRVMVRDGRAAIAGVDPSERLTWVVA